MNPVVLGLTVLLVVLACLSWVQRLRVLAWVNVVGLLLLLALTYLSRPWLPPTPELEAWGVVAGVALATIGGGPVASAILAHVKKTADADARRELALEYSSEELAAMATEPALPSLKIPQLRGGKWIGLLERLAIAGALAAGYPAGIPVVLAVKGLGRYPELQIGNAERFIIGTFASLLWAAGAGALALVR